MINCAYLNYAVTGDGGGGEGVRGGCDLHSMKSCSSSACCSTERQHSIAHGGSRRQSRRRQSINPGGKQRERSVTGMESQSI